MKAKNKQLIIKIKEFYYYVEHGLLWIVYYQDEYGCTGEDSRWESEDKAKEHCKLLNMKLWNEKSLPCTKGFKKNDI